MGTVYGAIAGAIVNTFASETEEYKNERLMWAHPHALVINAARAAHYQALVREHFHVGMSARLCSRACKTLGVTYRHFYIATVSHPEWVVQFGRGELSNTIVEVLITDTLGGQMQEEFILTQAVIERIQAVVGATAYSLVLRNCEHVARYIQSGAWVSLQMTTDEVGIGAAFRKAIMCNKDNARKLNQLPMELKIERGEHCQEQVRGMRPLINLETTQPLGPRYDSGAFNIVVLGPTGSGKSLFINRLFNRQLCDHSSGSASVTKEFCTFTGSAMVHGQQRRVNVIDSRGFCDSSISAEAVCKLVKDFLRTNIGYIDKLVILVSGRIERAHAESIRDILRWLRFDQLKPSMRGNYLFVYNKADQQNTPAERQASVAYMISQLQTGNAHGLMCNRTGRFACNRSLGIPLNASAEGTRAAIDSLLLLAPYRLAGKYKRIEVEPKSMCTIL